MRTVNDAQPRSRSPPRCLPHSLPLDLRDRSFCSDKRLRIGAATCTGNLLRGGGGAESEFIGTILITAHIWLDRKGRMALLPSITFLPRPS
jgi:hypothetical protein